MHLLGHVPRRGCRRSTRPRELLAFPSLYEGFGLPALEAMACGTPVCASSTTGLGEAVGDAGPDLRPALAEEIAECIAPLLEDEELRDALRAPASSARRASPGARSAEATAAVYREAIG